jgi:hypothetical protein
MIDKTRLRRIALRFVPTRQLVLLVIVRLLVALAAFEGSKLFDGHASTALAFVAHAALFMAAFGFLGHAEKVFNHHLILALDHARAVKAKRRLRQEREDNPPGLAHRHAKAAAWAAQRVDAAFPRSTPPSTLH